MANRIDSFDVFKDRLMNEYAGSIDVGDIEDCFREVLDIEIDVKIYTPVGGRLQISPGAFLGSAGFRPFDPAFTVSVTLNDLATEEAVSEYGERYSAVRDGQWVADVLVDSISKCVGYLDLEVFRAELKWVNAGELTHYRKMMAKSDGMADEVVAAFPPNLGPEILSRMFDQKCKGKLSDSLSATSGKKLNTSELDEVIREKGDRLRNLSVCLGRRKR